MDTKANTDDTLSLICLFAFLLGSLGLFAYQLLHYTTLLG
jgi:hypothetical protein